MQLQQFDHEHSPYERPNQKWVCGHAAAGYRCMRGPDSKGRCHTTAECEPIKRGDRWQCTRSRMQGGPCEDGPLPDGSCCRPVTPCQPRRSIRAKRGIFVLCATALVLGALALAMFSPGRAATEVMSPGDLTQHHAQILADTEQSCAACHQAEGESMAAMLHHAATAKDDAAALSQSQRCLDCHQDSAGLGEFALFPHGMPPEQMEQRTQRAEERAGASATAGLSPFAVPRSAEGELACATCHREHRGTHRDLAAMTDRQCQACHTQTFDSFADGHPEFTNWPHEQRTDIRFSHETHRAHFQDRNATFDCAQCHEPDAVGRTMRILPFEQSCAECHTETIALSADPGLAFFQLPGVDLYTLRRSEHAVGEWPEFANADHPVELNPWMRLLLAGARAFDPDAADNPAERRALLAAKREAERAAAAYEMLPDAHELYYLEGLSDEQLEAAADLVWAVKGLMFDLVTGGQAELHRRLRAALGETVSEAQLDELSAGLRAEQFVAAQQAWFPELLAEVPRYRAGRFEKQQQAQDDTDAETAADEEAQVNGGGDGEGDALLASDEASADDEDADGDTLLGGSSDEADEDEGDSLLAGDSSDDAEDSDDALLLGGSDDTDDTDDAGDSLLGGSEDADDADDAGDSLLGGSEDTDDTDDAGDSLLAGNGDEEDAAADDDDSLLLGGESADETSTDDEEPIPSAEPLPMAKMAAGRGWRIDDQAYAIRYQPAGHADAFLEQWLRAVAHQSDRPASTATRQVFDALTDANAVGRCIKCHSVDRTDERMFEVNWQAQPRDGVAKGFHRFAHQPHLIQPQLADCRHCHQEAADADVLAAFDGFDVRPFRGEFQPIQRNTCASCHTPDRAGDSCLDCHNYHTAHEVP